MTNTEIKAKEAADIIVREFIRTGKPVTANALAEAMGTIPAWATRYATAIFDVEGWARVRPTNVWGETYNEFGIGRCQETKAWSAQAYYLAEIIRKAGVEV